ncbi:MAG: 4-(cytidine 5'-diphospho)-2-C-methyl-D-erythritol kinase [Tannerellaceae bacterium]|jgi:4-diphosphocytidyl-2-C-methyl-D-erythritol kinase|nr:4-(cytidine 5'-diphospho)-2-C-methyl-D-erythritol kinase [Tannerellaceae bacterium]
MICFPNAKINLGLRVVSRRPDGYHDIETVFFPIPLRDALEVVEADAFSFSRTGIPLPDTGVEDNLAVKAMRRLLPPGRAIEVHLHKAIPPGSGLGGGSSDAASMLKLLNELYRLGLGDDRLEEMASGLGADCPFFIRNTPVFASGTGNVFEPVRLSLASYRLYLVIPPDIAVSTAEAYSSVRPQRPSASLKEIIRRPVEEWRGMIINDFEQSIFAIHPSLAGIRQRLYDAGAAYASMSGSGSAIFGLFDSSITPAADLPPGRWLPLS